MKFPGKRKTKYYFPIEAKGRIPFNSDFAAPGNVWVIGIEQLLVDIEINVDDQFLEQFGIPKGESVVLDDQTADQIYHLAKKKNLIVGEFAGGAVGNTLHNYSVLADDGCIVLGAVCENISVGDYAFKYICNTSFHMDFSYLKPCPGPMAKAMCFITPDNERSFGISKGIMNDLTADYIPEKIFEGAASLLITTFLLRDQKSSMFEATLRAVQLANKHNVPVILSLGTSSLVEENKEFLADFIDKYVNIVAMNEKEAEALTGESDILLAGQKVLDSTDLALITVGPKGLYLCGHVEESIARMTKDKIHSKSIAEYNKYEYSRAMLKKDCKKPLKIYSHINPYLGGPGTEIKNTNGAGDAALSAIMHDISANIYHRQVVPNSPKHDEKFLCYSSLHQIAKYANRVSFEVLKQNSPRLSRGLPLREANLEESYWAQ
jgi:inosine kinase